MGNQCGCCNNIERNSDFIISKNYSSPVNIACYKNKSNFFNPTISTKNNIMKEIDSLEPVHKSDFETPNSNASKFSNSQSTSLNSM